MVKMLGDDISLIRSQGIRYVTAARSNNDDDGDDGDDGGDDDDDDDDVLIMLRQMQPQWTTRTETSQELPCKEEVGRRLSTTRYNWTRKKNMR